jgi:hypothetical protein
MLDLVFQVVIPVTTKQFVLANILCLFLAHICLSYKHYVFGDQMTFLGQLVSLFQRNKTSDNKIKLSLTNL